MSDARSNHQSFRKKGYNFGAYDCRNGKIRIQMNGKSQLNKWQNEVGFNNERYLSKLEKL